MLLARPAVSSGAPPFRAPEPPLDPLVSLDLFGDGAWLWDLEHHRIRGSRRWLSAFGFPTDTGEVAAEAVLGLIHPDDATGVRVARDRHLAGFTDISESEYRMLDGDGHYRWVRERARVLERDAAGVPYKMVAAITDVTAQRQASSLAAVFRDAADPMFVADADGRIVRWNLAATRLLGYVQPEDTGLKIRDIVPGVGSATGLLTQFAAPKRGARPEIVRVRHLNGDDVPVELTASPVSPDRRLVAVTLREAAERLRLEQVESRLRQADKMQSLGALAGGIAHDFNNLLTVILGNLDTADLDLQTDITRVADSIDAARTASLRAVDLVRQILSFSRRQPTTRDVRQLGEIVTEVARMMRVGAPRHIAFDTTIATSLPPALVNTTQIHQVLMNLATNAWQAIEAPSGRVHLLVDRVAVPGNDTARRHGVTPGRWLRLAVSDTGCGMDARTMERMFEPLFTTKPAGKGTGLGLAVVHGIVSDHGGTIAVDSTPGQGTTITIYLPEAPGVEAATDAPQPPVSVPARVLLVDDDSGVREVIGGMLEVSGCAVETCADGAEALAAIESRGDHFDVVLSDYMMPALDGVALARALQERRPGMPFILMSGHLDDVSWDGPNEPARLAKPFSLDDARAAIAAALARPDRQIA